MVVWTDSITFGMVPRRSTAQYYFTLLVHVEGPPHQDGVNCTSSQRIQLHSFMIILRYKYFTVPVETENVKTNQYL